MKWNLVVSLILNLHVHVDDTGGGSIERGTGDSSGRGTHLGLRAVGALQGEARAVNGLITSGCGVVSEPSRRRPEIRKRDLRTVHVEGEGFVLVGRIFPRVLREELHPLATECSQLRGARHGHLDGLEAVHLRLSKLNLSTWPTTFWQPLEDSFLEGRKKGIPHSFLAISNLNFAPTTRWKALDEMYQICIPLDFSDLRLQQISSRILMICRDLNPNFAHHRENAAICRKNLRKFAKEE